MFFAIIDKYDNFYKNEKNFNAIARNYNLEISSEYYDDEHTFVISNNEIKRFDAFYGYHTFEVNFFIPEATDFQERANKFIEELEANPDFEDFHNLEWTDPAVRYFVTT